MIKAIVSGDLIHSSRLTPELHNALLRELKKEFRFLNKRYGMHSDIFRGDSFQCMLEEPGDALRVMLIVKSFIRSIRAEQLLPSRAKSKLNRNDELPDWIFDARMAMGIGAIDYKAKKITESYGPAFKISGIKLQSLKAKKMALAVVSTDAYSPELETESVLLDALMSRTTALQCEVIRLKILGFTEVTISKKLGIKQSAVNQRSTASHWNAIKTVIDRFDAIYNYTSASKMN